VLPDDGLRHIEPQSGTGLGIFGTEVGIKDLAHDDLVDTAAIIADGIAEAM